MPVSTVPNYEDAPVAGGSRSKRGIAPRGGERRNVKSMYSKRRKKKLQPTGQKGNIAGKRQYCTPKVRRRGRKSTTVRKKKKNGGEKNPTVYYVPNVRYCGRKNPRPELRKKYIHPTPILLLHLEGVGKRRLFSSNPPDGTRNSSMRTNQKPIDTAQTKPHRHRSKSIQGHTRYVPANGKKYWPKFCT